MAVSDYSTTAADNTTISGLAVTDSTVVDTVDNIIRQMMADTKSFYDTTALTGSAATITGAWAFSAIDVNGGAIDGTPIGGTTPAAGDFTTLDATGAASVAGALSVAADIQHTGDTDNKISFATDTQDFQTGGSSRLDISDSGVRLGGANARVTTVLDEDAMGSDSATALATQQSIKAYVDSATGGTAYLQHVGANLITSGSATIDVTSLSGYSYVIAYLSGQASVVADLIISARVSAGTWRTLATYSSLTATTNDQVFAEIHIENFDNDDATGRKNYRSAAGTANATITFSGGENDTAASARIGMSARAETWDEIRFELSAGQFSANSSEVNVWGVAA